VSKFFYHQGWCGINIEPNEWFFNKLVEERERDINLNVALGDKEEVKTFYVFKEYGLSTFDGAVHGRFVKQGFQSEQKIIGVTTLAAICKEHLDRPIDFLKIDCEGWEKTRTGWRRLGPVSADGRRS
jgi:FkbM family methyltransferase